LRVLRRPEVRAAFLVRKAEVKPRRRATPESHPKPFFTTTGWAILLCLLGIADTFLPWQNYKTRATDSNAFLMEQGVFLVVAYVALGLILITTYTADPVRVWKPAVLVVAAGFILMALLTYVDRVKQPLASTYYAFACAIGLLVVVAVQVRQILNRWKEGPP
jgi:multisubunit Na+/H+ antiporter MnhB subunit